VRGGLPEDDIHAALGVCRQRVLKLAKQEKAIAILLKSVRRNSRRSYATIVEKRSVY